MSCLFCSRPVVQNCGGILCENHYKVARKSHTDNVEVLHLCSRYRQNVRLAEEQRKKIEELHAIALKRREMFDQYVNTQLLILSDIRYNELFTQMDKMVKKILNFQKTAEEFRKDILESPPKKKKYFTNF